MIDMLGELEAGATPAPWTNITGCDLGVTVHCADGIGDEYKDVPYAIALRNAAPALLKVARAARELIDTRGEGFTLACMVDKLADAVAELEAVDGE